MSSRVRQVLYAGVGLVVGVYAVGHLTGAQGISALMEKREQIQQLRDETQRLEQENTERRKYLDDLKASADLQRRLVRERLHYVDEGAVDFKTPEAETKSGPKATQ